LKVKCADKEDELTQERALKQQQIQFTNQMANDLNTKISQKE